METLYRTRLTVLFASEAPKAVILRRGPKTHFRLIDWDLRSDTFVLGQWMKGTVQLSALSPRGNKLIYCAQQFHRRAHWDRSRAEAATFNPLDRPAALALRKSTRPGRKVPRYLRTFGVSAPLKVEGAWTAISAPPHFSALAIWPQSGSRTGGGYFVSEREIVLYEPKDAMTPIANVPIPPGVQIVSSSDLPRRGLQTTVPTVRGPSMQEYQQEARVRRALLDSGATCLEWVCLRHGDDMLFAVDGCVYRLQRWARVPEDRYLPEAKLLADFRDQRFALMTAPKEALHW
jgi:hypothetical protein